MSRDQSGQPLESGEEFASADEGDAMVALQSIVQEMSQQLAANPDDVVSLLKRGNACLELGELEAARADLGRALSLDARCASTHYWWACLKSEEEDAAAVREHVQLAIQNDIMSPGQAVDIATDYAASGRPMAQFMLADLHLNDGHLDKALDAINQAIRLDSESGAFYQLRGELQQLSGDLPGALRDLTKAIELDPEDWEVRIERSLALLESGRQDEAFAEIDTAFVLAEDEGLLSAELFVTRGEAYTARGDTLRAREDFRKALDLDPDCLDAHLGLSDLAIRSRDFEIAQRHLSLAEQLDPNEPSIHLNRGVLAKEQGDKAAALVALEVAIARAPDCAEAYYLRGQLRQELGQSEVAEHDFNEAMRRGYVPPVA
jgi:tetratricopeptide (TPR) repeat protein